MPVFYRLVKRKFSSTPFDGEGARQLGGRWNSKGVSVAYASDSVALAVLEVLVHLHFQEALQGFDLCLIEIPERHVLRFDDAALPQDWQADPPAAGVASVGDQWVASSASLVLSVPSVVVPRQRNLLINPHHPAFAESASTIRAEPFQTDPRLAALAFPK